MRTIKVSNSTGSIHGMTPAQVQQGIEAGFNSWLTGVQAALSVDLDVKFVFVTIGAADYYVKTKSIYGGVINGRHTQYRGLGQIGGKTMWLHSGYIPGHQGNQDGKPYYWTPFTSVAGLTQIVAHEWGHNLGIREHSSDRACLMHGDAAGSICPAEARVAVKKFGSTVTKPEPEPEPFFKPGDVVDAVNIPLVAKGAVRVNGQWKHILGSSIVLHNAKVIVYEPESPEQRCCVDDP